MGYYSILIPPLENPGIRTNFKRKEQKYINSLLNSEEFQRLSEENQHMALSSLRFVIRGRLLPRHYSSYRRRRGVNDNVSTH